MSQKLCARYLYFKRNVEKFGVRVIGRKIWYFVFVDIYIALATVHATYFV